MTVYALLEQSVIANDRKTSAHRGVSNTHVLVAKAVFDSKAKFAEGLRTCISALFKQPDETPKLLILSAHGIPRTGTDLEASDAETIDLWEFADYFKVLPPTLVVYVSACFGCYPSAGIIQNGNGTPPFVVGPLVDISFDHANKFQSKILDALALNKPTRCQLLRLVANFNKDRYSAHYGGRFLFGLYDSERHFFPRRAIGSQYSAPVEGRTTFSIRALESIFSTKAPTHYRLENEHGAFFKTSISDLAYLAEDLNSLVGKRVSARYQVIASGEDGSAHIVLLQVRKR